MHDCLSPNLGQTVADEATARTALSSVPDSAALNNIAELYKMFADTTRLKILCLLQHGELCVCDIAQLSGTSQSAISHQLRVLKSSRLVSNRRDGKAIFYALADDHIHTILRQGMEHVSE